MTTSEPRPTTFEPRADRRPATIGRVMAGALKARWPHAATLAAVIVLAMALEAVPPLVLERLVDYNLARGVVSGIWTLAALFLLTIFAQRGVVFGQNYLTTVIGQDILHRLRLALVGHLGALPLGYYDSTPVGETMSRCTADVEAVNTLFTSGVISVIADSMRLVGVIGAMFVLSARLAWVTLIVVPVVLVLTEFFRRNIRGAQRRARVAVGRINSTFQESLNGIKVIHTFGQERTFEGRLDRDLGGFLAAVNRASLFNSYFPPAMDILKGLLTAALIWVGITAMGGAGAGVAAGLAAGVTVGVLVAYLQLVGRLFNPLTSLSDEWQTIQEALAGVERINEVLRLAAEPRPAWSDPPPGAAKGRVLVADLRFGYQPDRPVLHGVDLEVRPGQRLAIAGRTGAGKTSFLSLLAGVYAPWEGAITVDGVDPRSIRPGDRRRLLGVVPQTIQLTDGTIRENITLGDSTITAEVVTRVGRLVGLDDYFRTLPQGYDTYLGPGGIRLSHGQEQLLSLARALACEPAVLLLDEPTSGLDAETEARLFAAVREVSRDRTTITISHRLSGVVDAERVIIMAGGRIVQDGPPERLAQEDGWFAMMRALESLGWQSGAAGR